MKMFKFYSFLNLLLFSSSLIFSQVNGISILDVKTGLLTEVVNLADSPAFNPSFSNNGKKIAFDTYGGYNGIYITDLQLGSTYPLVGGLDGNDASWSPDGEKIVFDRYGYEILYVPAGGGNAEMITYGIDAEWNNTSEKIVYNEFGILKTVNLDGSGETTVSNFGSNPSWSPNGDHIAFTDGQNLWLVDVDVDGNALGAPYQITFDGPNVYNQQPSWSMNSQSLAFHSNRTTDNFDFDIWKVNILDGAISRVTGVEGIGDFDPCYSKNGKYITFSTIGNSNQASKLSNANATLIKNYPNPFKNSTSITYEVKQSGALQLLIYDQMGRLVKELLNSNLEAGVYEVNWDPSLESNYLNSGIFILRMITSEGIQTKKLVYQKN